MRHETDHEAPHSAPSDGERTWRVLFFVLSAGMAAYALVQLINGRVAAALGDIGVVCLLVSLIPQFPFVRAILLHGLQARAEEELLHDLDRVRQASPWVETVSAAGWLLLGASILLRVFGVA